MPKSGKDERSWEDRVAAMDGTLGESQTAFDHAATDSASEVEVLADEILLGLKRKGMTPIMALHVAQFISSGQFEKIAAFNRDNEALGAMDSLIRADLQKHLLEILCRIVEAPKPRLSVGCLMLALGMNHTALSSQRRWAKNQAVSLEHVSNEVTAWQVLLGLPATSSQKSEAAKESYRLTNQPRKAA